MKPDADRAADRLFRRSAGRLVAALARALGPERIDLAEEVVQDALVRALEVWRFRGVPDNPEGWLYRVARRRALDLLRRDATARAKLELLPPPSAFEAPAADRADLLADDELALLFLCCHPTLSPDSRVALTLKVACGFSVGEIAAALLAEPAAVAQRIVRAKRALRERGLDLRVPEPDAAVERLDGVLECVYLLFNEGYDAHDGEDLVREELCFEAIRLGETLARHRATDAPEVRALLALMCLQASRLRARSRDGELVLLDRQDRDLWDARLVAAGMRHLDAAARGDELTAYHVEAALAAQFVAAEPDWRRVLSLYDQLLALAPTPVVRLNRAVAVAKVRGPRAALDELAPLHAYPAMRRYYLLPALTGAFLAEAGEPGRAREAYRAALRLRCNATERRFMEEKLRALDEAESPAGAAR